jgi:hypothetical protein
VTPGRPLRVEGFAAGHLVTAHTVIVQAANAVTEGGGIRVIGRVGRQA